MAIQSLFLILFVLLVLLVLGVPIAYSIGISASGRNCLFGGRQIRHGA